jgi:hypothetical protein
MQAEEKASWHLQTKGRYWVWKIEVKSATSTNNGDIAYCSLVIYFMIEYDN